MKVKNNKCIFRLSWRALRAFRKRNMIAIVAIALTSLLFTSLFTIAMSINSSYEMYTFRQIGGYSHGTFKDVTEEQAQAIAAHPNVKATGRRSVIGFIDSGVFAKVPAEVSFMDENCTAWSFAKPSTGHQPLSGKEITMDTTALKLLGIEPELGAKIQLTYTVGDKSQTAYEKTDIFTLSGWWEYDDISPVHYINISEEYAASIEKEGVSNGMEAFRADLNVMMMSGIDIQGQMEQVDLDLGYIWDKFDGENVVRIGVNWGYTASQLGGSMDPTVVFAIVAFLAIVIFTGYLIIYNIFQISVTGDIRFYGLLKTIGVTPRQLRRIIRQQALLLCIVGIPVGLLLGYGIGVALTPFVMENTIVGSNITTVSASPVIFIGAALFALVTVLLSCARPGRTAARVSPIEAAKYTENVRSKKKRRSTRGAKVYQMAFANLGRNKSKTILVVLSLSLSVVLLNILVTFTGGFDMEKYLDRQICGDFIVSSTDYFRFKTNTESYISAETMEQIETNTEQFLSGCGYRLSGTRPVAWMSEESWKMDMKYHVDERELDVILSQYPRRGDLVGEDALVEGLDESLFEKLTVADGTLTPMLRGDDDAIALAVYTDDYGNIENLDYYPAIGETLTLTYIEEAYYIDSRTGEKSDENTPAEYLEYKIAKSKEVDYTICAYVTVPYSMSFRYSIVGYNLILPAGKLDSDSGHTLIPMFYLFDTVDAVSEADAESYLASLTSDPLSGLMYESKATVRADFENFRNMFLLLGGLLCAIIGLVGILNFFNAIMTGILSRKREFAVLQAVGMTNKQLKAMLIYEGLFYSLGSVFAALILSVMMSPLVGNLLERMFWFFRAHFNILPVLLTVPIFALLGWLIPSVMYSHGAKHSIVERLRETE